MPFVSYSMINRVLDDGCRDLLFPTIIKMTTVIPEMMARKLPRANVQQAFAVDMIENIAKASDRILCVGSYEDTAYEYLKKTGYSITDIDPVKNYDLHTYSGMMVENYFDIIFSISVIEHVADDEGFIADICRLLKPGGKAILTCDFLDSFEKWMNVPAYRFYTSKDLCDRLNHILRINHCNLVNEPEYKNDPDFWYQGHTYSLATYVFKKNVQ